MKKTDNIIREIFFFPESSHTHHDVKTEGGKPTTMTPKFKVFCAYLNNSYDRIMFRTKDLSFTGGIIDITTTRIVSYKHFNSKKHWKKVENNRKKRAQK